MRLLIICIVSLACVSASYSQIKFFKLFSNNGVDIGQGVVQLEDSSYVITGSSSSFFNGPSQVVLLSIDSSGTYQWSKDFGGPESDVGRRILYKKNVGYFVCGYSNSAGNGDFDMYVLKVGEDLNKQWEKYYGGSGWDKVHDAALTRDTGLLMVGETSSSNLNENSDIYIVRTNIDGDTLWTKTIGGVGDDIANSITQHNDSMFVIGGQIWNEDSLMTKGYVIYLKDDGTVMWEHTSGANGDYWINDIVVDGARFAAIGGTTGLLKDGIDFYFCPLDFGGSSLGPYEQPAAGDEDFKHITKYGDGSSFYIVSHREGAGTFEGGTDVLVNRFLTSMLWQSGFGVAHEFPDVAGDVIPTSDGGAIVVGYTTNVVNGGNELFALKIGPNDDYPDPIADVEIHDIVSIYEGNMVIPNLLVYPNPAVSEFTIEGGDKLYKMSLYSLSGSLLIQDEFFKQESYDLEGLEMGTYLINVIDESNNREHFKLVIH